MLGQHLLELGEAARILVLKLHARRPEGVPLRKGLHARPSDCVRDNIGLRSEGLALVELGPIAAATDAERQRARLMAKPKMQSGETSHRETDDMGARLAERLEHGENVVRGS